jgi:uncharacterized metal-binding protein
MTAQKEVQMNCENTKQALILSTTGDSCPIGEKIGAEGMAAWKIPVLSCEGACIRGEIARLAANQVAREEGFGRGCHGEFLTVPQSAIAQWIKAADKVVLIDGCFLRCHGRVMENLLDSDKLIQFDALSHYKRYNNIFDYEDVPEAERKEVAQSVADWVLSSLQNPTALKSAQCSQKQSSCSPCCG